MRLRSREDHSPARPRTERLAALLAAAFMLTTSACTAAQAQATSPKAAIDWQACEDASGVECATLKVPLDWSKPKGKTIEIGLARRKATGARIGSILMDPGGPGVSAVDEVKRKENLFTPAISERFDVVGFDPRGVNTSTPVTCSTELIQKADEAKRYASRSEADFEALRQINKELSEDCRERTGPLYDHVDNLHVIQDIDAIRRALGEDKITQVGYSYGTEMIQQYAEKYPQHVRALVADGNVDRSLQSAWDFLDGQTAAMENNFNQWADWCDKTPDCALYGLDTRKVYGELREHAKDGTLVNPATGEVLDFGWLSSRAQAVSFPEGWKELATVLKPVYDGIGTTPTPSPTSTPEPPEVPETRTYPRQAMWCEDWTFEIKDYAELKSTIARLSQRYPNVEWNPNATDGALDCVGWEGRTTNPQKPIQVKDDLPLVMIGNLNDPMSVYQWSKNSAEQSGATLVTYEGFGHTIYPSTVAFGPSTCINDAIDDFLIDLKTPDAGTSCPAIEVPGEGTKPSPLAEYSN
ncbi:alpha/beta hydrolase [Nonomuraea sp. FMUSA5-5]|uniref:Alpha/beta hydrolase n=1 Tax=Nonomuraea composti TaxID=2720023 RepID=A0ABX1BH46_9ACTN|nr:alpha/beta hydrolase [Nonomuraea sp. FMUSA5-5]NJP97065.1 alpha/beta hydrolase [Nonomuraea sp. FMUSA5-5]